MDKKKFCKRNMEWFSKRNIYVYCCIVAVLSMTSYLAAFSIEISWLLEARGDLPTPSYLLCAGYFVLFIASTILIHGLASRIPWGLLSWSTIIALALIPEFYLVIYMITQHWGLQSIHGLTELVGYLLRLVINCLALLCVIPTALNWRSEKRVQKQLESLANRLQLTTPLPDAQISAPMPGHIINEKQSGSIRSTSSRRSRTGSVLNHTGFSNLGFESQGEMLPPVDATLTSSSENEFNASIFGLNPSMYIGPPGEQQQMSKKTQSLLDLRYLLSPKSLIARTKDDQELFKLNNDQNHNTISPTSTINSRKVGNKCKVSNIINNNATNIEEPFYHTIDSYAKDPAKSLARNCVSLENLNNTSINTFYRNDLNMYGNNLLQNYGMQWPGRHFAYAPPPPQYFYYYSPYQHSHVHQHPSGQYFNPYISSNSRQSVGTSSTDDFRKYRDVAL